MKVTELEIPGLVLFEPSVFSDARGAFLESFNAKRFHEATGLGPDFVQDNQSISHKGVVRGLHYQLPPHVQGKLVRVVSGAAFDVAVDLRRNSPTFGKWAGVELSAENHRQLWVPPGFAHGFLALEEDTRFLYKVTDFWHAPSERSLKWDDPAIAIAWPLTAPPILSQKDLHAPGIADAELFD